MKASSADWDDAGRPRMGAASPHLLAACMALGTAALILATMQIAVQRRLPGRLESFASSISSLKMTGNLLQSEAFAERGVLPVYGSSELDHHADNRPDAFFRDRPTGFSVFPVGHAGTTCLMILQKIAAAGNTARGKQTVVFLSPTWFAKQEVARNTVTANLPAAQLGAWIFDSPLSHVSEGENRASIAGLPRDDAGPTAVGGGGVGAGEAHSGKSRGFRGPLAARKMSEPTRTRVGGRGVALGDARASERSGEHTPGSGSPEGEHLPAQEPDWRQLAEQAEARDRARNDGTAYSATTSEAIGSQRKPGVRRQVHGARDADFGGKMGLSKEWSDLELLTEVLRDLQIRALFISQPFNGNFYDMSGTTHEGRRMYYEKLAGVIGPSGYGCRDYSEHEEDRFFFNDSGHPSAKAWIFYDRALDQFYHGAMDRQ